MDPVSIILAFALQHPQVVAGAVNGYATPGQVDPARLQSSAADFAMQTLSCYHKSARFRGVEILGSPWAGQATFGAEASVVMRVHFNGISGSAYQIVVAAMARGNNVRTFVLGENSLVPYNKNCSLEQWTPTVRQ